MTISITRSNTYATLYDIAAVILIYMLPTLSHLLSFPLYLIDPMRVVVFISMTHFRKSNAYFVALSLPFVSFLLSGHPVPFKVILISLELVLNVYLFFFYIKRNENAYLSAFISIVISKLAYYSLKFVLISVALLQGDLVSTSIYYQFITMLILITYVSFFYKNDK